MWNCPKGRNNSFSENTMNTVVIAGYEYDNAEAAARAYKSEVDKCEPADALERGEIETEVYEGIRAYHDEVPQSEFDAFWTEVTEAMNRI
jgi:hypothetical protein